jgi:hypothetical protein
VAAGDVWLRGGLLRAHTAGMTGIRVWAGLTLGIIGICGSATILGQPHWSLSDLGFMVVSLGGAAWLVGKANT